MSGTDAPGPDVPVLWPLVQVAHLARRRFDRLFAGEGVTGPQFGVLAALADGDDLSSSDLARAILVRPQSMATLVDSMVAAGLVRRRGQGGRGRRTVVELTDHGRDVVTRLRADVAQLASPEVTGLDDHETRVLHELLDTLRAALVADPVRSTEEGHGRA